MLKRINFVKSTVHKAAKGRHPSDGMAQVINIKNGSRTIHGVLLPKSIGGVIWRLFGNSVTTVRGILLHLNWPR